MLEVSSSTNHYKENNIILCGLGHYLLEPQTLLEIILKKLVNEEKEPNRTWLKESMSERKRVRSPLSHLIELETLLTMTPPGKTRSWFRFGSISTSLDPLDVDLQAERRTSEERS